VFTPWKPTGFGPIVGLQDMKEISFELLHYLSSSKGRKVRAASISSQNINHKRKKPMPQTLDKTFHGQIIGGTFSNRENADQAIKAFEELEISPENIKVLVQLNENKGTGAYEDILTDRGFSESQARYYDKVVREGKILLTIHGVTDPAPIIDIFDKYNAEYNPNGSRNLREDVLGMTTGAMVGAAAFGVVGGALGGPGGAAAGAVAGALVGGGSGAVAGKAAEHSK